MCFTAPKDAAPAFACNLRPINAADRPHYHNLAKRVRAAIRRRTEVSNGYVYTLNGKGVTLPEVAEWIAMERLCCPFLTLQLSASGSQADWVLMLTGPDG